MADPGRTDLADTVAPGDTVCLLGLPSGEAYARVIERAVDGLVVDWHGVRWLARGARDAARSTTARHAWAVTRWEPWAIVSVRSPSKRPRRRVPVVPVEPTT